MIHLHARLPGVSNHAQHRAVDYLGELPSRGEWMQLLLDILDRRAVLLNSDDGSGRRCEIYLCELRGRRLRAVWAPGWGGAPAMLVTLMPLRERSLSHTVCHSDARKGMTGPTRREPRRALARERDWLSHA